jgi:hypothetical protein
LNAARSLLISDHPPERMSILTLLYAL